MALDWLTKQLQTYDENKTGIQFTMLTKLEDLEFSDGIVLLSQKIANARQRFKALQYEAANWQGLEVNNTKTKEMRIGTPSKQETIFCKDQPLERVQSLFYLVSIVTTIGGSLRGRYTCKVPWEPESSGRM